MKRMTPMLGLLLLVAVAAGVFIWSGAYNIAADEPHWSVMTRVMETVRDRSIEARLSGITAPDLADESLIRAGAGNYDAMCADCHGHPGEDHSVLGSGMYPAPPDLAGERIENSVEAFWVIKHGIKMTGMPAWGKHMDDKAIWGIVAFLQQLPGMSEASYRELVESSEGHSHDSGEEHVHADDEHQEHND